MRGQPGVGVVILMLLTLPSATMWKQKDLERIAQRAKSAGYRRGEHAAHDKLRGRTKFETSTLATQDQSLVVYLV
jgi:type II secretory pathway pseudopilin PulG